MAQPAKVAVPPTAADGLAVHESVAPSGVVIASVTALVASRTGLPKVSCTVTAGWAAHAAAAAPPPGCEAKASLFAAPAVTVTSPAPLRSE